MLVNHFTFTWIMYEYEYRVRQGLLSFALLRPVHPIHSDIADNVSYKLITMPLMLAAALVLGLLFHPSFHFVPWAVAAFVPVLLLAFLVRFLFEWMLALSAFWTTRVSALNQSYFIVALFLSGQIAPLSLLPRPIQTAATALPFRWTIGFPVELLLGRLTPAQALTGFAAQAAWLAARRRPSLLGGGRMKYQRLLLVFFRVGVMGELAYRVNFFVQLFESILELGTALAGLAIVFSHTSTLGGWRPDEVLALVGVYFLVGGAIRVLIQPSMTRLIESVREGTLDFTLTKPEDAQLLVSIKKVEIWQLIDIALGFGVLGVALARLGAVVGAWQAAGFAVALLAGGVIVYSFWLILATLSFWFVRVENILMIFQSMYEAGWWPISLYPGWQSDFSPAPGFSGKPASEDIQAPLRED
jgi:ABC-2 type transport system permease protein